MDADIERRIRSHDHRGALRALARTHRTPLDASARRSWGHPRTGPTRSRTPWSPRCRPCPATAATAGRARAPPASRATSAPSTCARRCAAAPCGAASSARATSPPCPPRPPRPPTRASPSSAPSRACPTRNARPCCSATSRAWTRPRSPTCSWHLARRREEAHLGRHAGALRSHLDGDLPHPRNAPIGAAPDLRATTPDAPSDEVSHDDHTLRTTEDPARLRS